MRNWAAPGSSTPAALCGVRVTQAQTQFLDRNLEAHAADDGSAPLSASPLSNSSQFMSSYHAVGDIQHTIRFQVIVWSISSPDVKTHRVSMKFRVTLFWNDSPQSRGPTEPKPQQGRSKKTQFVWAMSGRSTACQKKISDDPAALLDVPPISILNADSMEAVGTPEVQLLREDTQLYRWSCMYRAQLHQNDISVDQFPHDEHDLQLKLGILSQRQPGGRWDRRKWKLALANASDTQGSIRIPFGVLVDQVKIPGFYYDQDGLNFELAPLEHGTALHNTKDRDYCLLVKLRVKRNSGYYDNNIMPLLTMLNLVSISILSQDATNDFNRSLLSLNIAFVEVGLRMSLDSHLPHVGYQIKMQKVLNFFFFSILTIVLESSILNYLLQHELCSIAFTRKVDLVMAVFLLLNQVYLTIVYTSFHRLRQVTQQAQGEANEW
jgi:hypothetical protein